MDYTFLDKMRPGKMAGPAWLKPLAPHAQVESTCLHVMNSLITPEDSGPGLKEIIEDIIGDILGYLTLSMYILGYLTLVCMQSGSLTLHDSPPTVMLHQHSRETMLAQVTSTTMTCDSSRLQGASNLWGGSYVL